MAALGVTGLTVLMLAATAIFIELRTAFSIPFVRNLIERFTLLGIVFSIGLSIIIGGIFSASGVVVMLGAMIAISVTQPVYMVAAAVKRTGHDVAETVEQVRSVFRPFWSLFKLAFRIMAFPFIIAFRIIRFIDRHTGDKATAPPASA